VGVQSTNNTWTWVSGSNTIPANGVISGVYGTQGIPAPANVPGARYGAVSWADKNGNLWLFGGDGFDSTGQTPRWGRMGPQRPLGLSAVYWHVEFDYGKPANTAILAGRTQQFTAMGTYSDSKHAESDRHGCLDILEYERGHR